MATDIKQADAAELEARADRAAAAGDPRAARRLLERALDADRERLETWLKLAAICRALGDAAAALEAVSGALRIDPLGFLPLLMKANLLEAIGRADEAGEAYGHALAQRPDEVPPHLRTPLDRAERVHAAFVARTEQALLERGKAFAGRMSEAETGRLTRFASNIVRRTRPYHSEPSHFHYPGLTEREFHEREQFPWLADLEAAAARIAEEFQRVMASERAELVPYVQYSEDQPLRQWKGLNWNKAWTAVHLLKNGARIEANARHCPETLALLDRIGQPGIPGLSPNAMFSLLAPNTHIPPHTGVANTRLVCHLPLIVPPGCWFRVGAETREWEVGKAFLFDDTIEHEAANDGDQLRVVLIFDVWHPGLGPAERDAVTAMMAGGPSGSEPAAVVGGADPAPAEAAPSPAPVPAPADLQARRTRAVALMRGGDAEAALAELRGLLAVAPDDPETAADAGLVARRCGAEAQILALVQKAADANPRHVRVWQVLGLLQRALDETPAALEAFGKAAQLAPGDPLIAHSRARTLLEAGQPAVAAFGEARRLAPQDRSVLVGQLAAMVAEGRSDEAIATLRSELSRDPQWVEGHSVLARHLWAMGDRQGFTDAIVAALEKSPRDLALWRELIVALMRAERHAEALEAVARARVAAGPDTLFDANEAACHVALGHLAEADGLFEKLGPLADTSIRIHHFRHLLRTQRPEEVDRLGTPLIGTQAVTDLWPYLSLAWRMTGDPRWQWLEGDPGLVGVYDLGGALPPLDDLAARLRVLHLTTHQPLDQSLRGGTQTDGPLFSRAEPEIRALRQAVVEAVRTHVAQLPAHDPNHPQLNFRRDSVRFSGSWSVRLLSGGRHVSHVHPQGWFSSALYVALPPLADRGPEPAGWLALGEPPDELELDLPPLRLVEPKPGRLALFPSTMWHGTRPFDEGERLTVAFDVAPPL